MIESMLGANPAVTTLPIGSEDNFQGVIDLVAMKAITWNGEVRCSQPDWALLLKPRGNVSLGGKCSSKALSHV